MQGGKFIYPEVWSFNQFSKVFVIVLPVKTKTQASSPNSGATHLNPSLQEYQHLKNRLFLLTVSLVVLVGAVVWAIYGTNKGLSFCLGGLVGVAYLRMLARSVDQLGSGSRRLGMARLGLFIALIIVAGKWQTLELLPAFFGFLTYKLAVLALMLRDLQS